MKFLELAASVACLAASAFAIVPNANLSHGKTAIFSGSTSQNETYLTDGSLENWKYVTSKDIAINVGEGATKLFVTWETLGDDAWATDFTTGCGHSGTPLSDFAILTSANSTTGTDGDWDTALVVTENPVMSRGVFVDFAGKSWIRFSSETDMTQLLEIEAFDVSNGGDDTWFFMGTSISQMGLKQQTVDSTTADMIHARIPEYTPAMLRGGIGCINSTEVVAHLADYLKYAGNVHFWAIEMGTNDAWGGGDGNLANYIANMQEIIDSAKAHQITPIIARIIATNEEVANWQVNPAYLTSLDSLVEVNNLPKGPDFYTYFLAHPEELSTGDGVHPNASTGGGQSMHKLWAEALETVYKDSLNSSEAIHRVRQNTASPFLSVRVHNGMVEIRSNQFGNANEAFDLKGRSLPKNH